MYEFKDIVENEAELRKVMGKPNPVAVQKTIDFLDANCRTFIARSPYMLVASSDGQGAIDVSPKGDPAGFVHILDDHTLVIPERPGNQRADTFTNVLKHPHIGLIFLVPTRKETLRVSGRAQVIKDSALLQTMAIKGETPKLGLALHVERAFFHCGKSVARSGLWRADNWADANDLPSLAQIIFDIKEVKVPKVVLKAAISMDEKTRLY